MGAWVQRPRKRRRFLQTKVKRAPSRRHKHLVLGLLVKAHPKPSAGVNPPPGLRQTLRGSFQCSPGLARSERAGTLSATCQKTTSEQSTWRTFIPTGMYTYMVCKIFAQVQVVCIDSYNCLTRSIHRKRTPSSCYVHAHWATSWSILTPF